MVRPNGGQLTALEGLRESVLVMMASFPFVDEAGLALLRSVPLGVLRKNATQRHGVTRWMRSSTGGLTVQTVDLHPKLLTTDWENYASFVLYHEFLHVLGWRAHDARFRALEALWPDGAARTLGPSFTHAMRARRAAWMWTCPSCDFRFPRQRRGRGKFLCRRCRTVLLDVPVKDAQ